MVLGYVFYGKLMEKLAGVNPERETPAYKLENGVDYVPMNKYKVFLIHFLNIAGLGPIFGTIQGALFGPAAFLWIVFGTLFAGTVYEFFSYVSYELNKYNLFIGEQLSYIFLKKNEGYHL